MSAPGCAAEKSAAGQGQEDLSEKVTFEPGGGREPVTSRGKAGSGGAGVAATGRPCDLWSWQRLREGFDSG